MCDITFYFKTKEKKNSSLSSITIIIGVEIHDCLLSDNQLMYVNIGHAGLQADS